MKGRRSSDDNFAFGHPNEFSENVFPKDKEIVSHAHFLRRKNCSLGVWKSNTPDQEVSKAVTRDLCGIWDKTPIPHYGNTNIRYVERRVETLLGKAKDVLKIPIPRRNESELAEVWGNMFEITLCPHRQSKLCDCPNCDTPHPEKCDCPNDKKVPDAWVEFLFDQRGPRKQSLAGIDRKRLKLEASEREREESQRERKERDEESFAIAKMKADQNVVDDKASFVDLVDSQGKRLSQGLVLDDDGDDEDDSDWEEGGEQGLGGEGAGEAALREYNTLNLPRFCRELDRYKASNREGAKVGNALLKDLGVVHDENLQFLLCPAKIMRQRMKHGKVAATQHAEKPPPGLVEEEKKFLNLKLVYSDALYFDGKKCDTLVRETKVVNVQVKYSEKLCCL